MKFRTYKFRLYPSKQQQTLLCQHLETSRLLWNSLLEQSKKKYQEEQTFFSKSELQKMVKGSPLYSQAAQAVCHRLHAAIRAKVTAKKQGRNWGFPRFKPKDRAKSLYYPQFGFHLEKKLAVTPFGEMAIKKHMEIKGSIRTLAIKRESSGKFFAIFCVEADGAPAKINLGSKVGVDLGLKHFATFSDGQIIQNPRHLKKHETKLAFLQRELSKKRKGGRNRQKAKLKVARAYENMANARHDFLHKAANNLLSSYSLIALEQLHAREMAQKNYGKWINDAAWRTFSHILAYKAESAGCKVAFVNPEGTTKECSACGTQVQKTLRDRMHMCPACGLVIDRDLNASINILNRATAGIAGSNTRCGHAGNGAVDCNCFGSLACLRSVGGSPHRVTPVETVQRKSRPGCRKPTLLGEGNSLTSVALLVVYFFL